MLDIENLRRQVWSASGRLEGLRARRDSLIGEVRVAKDILALRDDARQALEKLQADSNARIIDAYNTLLSALVADILPSGNSPADAQDVAIRLNLYTDRGLPALDVEGLVGDSRAIDLYDGAGGSLTNVVCLGLRSIAAAASGMRRFLCLDEADCWLAPERISVFYSVLKKLADQSKFQTLAISHHDNSLFSSGVNILHLSGTPRTGLSVSASPDRAAWESPEAEGIRSIRLQNFAGFVDATFHLSPGVNAIVGRNNIGKSRVMKALRAVCYGDARDSDIRHGQNQVTVVLELERGMTLTWSRKPSRNPVQQWELVDRSGEIMTIDGEYCQSGKRRRGADARVVPAWVSSVMGIDRLDGLDIHLTHQKKPVFLLEEPATRRAAVLNVGREASRVQGMIAAHKRRVEKATRISNDGERELNVILRQIVDLEASQERLSEHLLRSDALSSDMALLRSTAGNARSLASRIVALHERRESLMLVSSALERLPSRMDVTADVSRAEKAHGLARRISGLSGDVARNKALFESLTTLPEAPKTRDARHPMVLAERISRGQAEQSWHEQVLTSLSELPLAPEMRDVSTSSRLAERILSSRARMADLVVEIETADQDIESNMADRDALLASNGSCPLCGSQHGEHHAH